MNPTHVAASSRHDAKPTDQTRRREMVCNLLTQIFVLAERTRASKRSVSDEETEPISLIELIQASYSVFERYGIGPPYDAVYHRYLLSLSINPERDWRRKILNLDLGTQPRVKRLCTGHRHALDSGVQRRQKTEKHNAVRRASLVSDSPTPARKSTLNSGFSLKKQRQQDRFSDMLSLDSPIQEIHVSDKGFFFSKPQAADNDEERQLQMITTSMEQWRATQAVKQLVNQRKIQNLQSRKLQILTWCTHAIFRWVTSCLPEKIDFHAKESPRALPLCILRRISVDVKNLKKSAKRVWIWQMKTLLDTWHQDAQKIKTFRVRMMIKQRAAVLETVFYCIQRWRLFTETKKCSNDRAEWISQRQYRSSLRLCLNQWRRAFWIKNQQHNAERHYTSRLKRKVLKFWQILTESMQEERNRFEMARKRQLFSRWKRGKERKQASRALLRFCSDQRRLRSLSHSWNKLRANISRNQTARTRLKLWEESSRQRRKIYVFQLWKMAIEQQKDFCEREKRFLRFSRRRHLSQHFAAWAGWTERQVMTAKILSDVTEARACKQIPLYFAVWKKHFEEASHFEEEIVARVTYLRRKRVWNHWRKSTGTRSATRYLDSAYSFHLVAKLFTRWQQYTTKKAERYFAFLDCQDRHQLNVLKFHWELLVENMNSQHEKQLAAENANTRKLMELKRIFFSAWQAHFRRKKTCRLRGEQLQYSAQRWYLMQSTWDRWRWIFWLRTGVRLADIQLHKCRKSHSFRLWKQFVFKTRQRSERALKVVEILDNIHVKTCFRQWKNLLIAKHKLAIKSAMTRQLVCTRLLTSRWKTWRRALEVKRGQQKRLSAVSLRWQHRQLYASFRCWKTTWCIRKRHRHLLQSTLLTSKQRILEAHFTAWRKKCRTSAARELQILEIQDRLLCCKVKRAIQRWNSRRLKLHKRRDLVVKSLALWRQNLLLSGFKRLLDYTRKRKFKASQSQVVQSQYRTQSVQRIFSVWSQFSRNKEEITRKLENARRRLDALKMTRAIQKLRHNSRLNKRLRTAQVCVAAMSSGHVKVAAFSRWKDFIVQKHKNHNNDAARVLAMKNFRVQRRITRWKQFVQVRKLLKHKFARAVTVSTTSRLQTHFVNWKKFVTRQIFTRALRQKAAAFRYFCLLPLYFKVWKRFLSGKMHNQELLLRARGLWCHQNESRAFKAWVSYSITHRQTKCAVSKWKNQLISRSFTSWKRFESLKKKINRDQIRAVNFYERRTCNKVLKEWSLTSRHDRLARNCAQMWYQNTSRRGFDCWNRHVRLRQSSRKFLGKIRNQTLSRIFTAWKERIELKTQQLQGIQERFALLWMNDARKRSFSRWKRYAHFRCLTRTKLEGKREILLQNVVKQWRRVVVFRQRSRQCALLVADRVQLTLLRKIWSNWRSKARICRCVKALRGKMLENRVNSGLRERICRWKQFTILSLAVKKFACCRDTDLMRMVFLDGFQRFNRMKRKERALTKQIQGAHEAYLKEWLARKLQHRMSIITACEELRRLGSSKRLLSVSWSAWMDFHRKKQTQQASIRQLRVQISHLEDQDISLDSARLCGMLGRWRSIQVTRVFEHWNVVTVIQKQVRAHTLKAMEWWLKTQCGRYFNGWKRFCQQQRMQRQIRKMSVKSKLQRVWKLWQAFRVASTTERCLTLKTRQFHAKHVYRRSLKTWRKAASCLRVRREQILELYHSSRLHLLAALFNEWRKFAAMEKTKRVQRTIARVVNEQKVIKRSFTEWKTNVAGIIYHRRQLQINTERLQVLLLCSSFRAWRSWSKQTKKLKSIMQILSNKCDANAASRVFKAWHFYAEKSTRVRHQASSFLRFRGIQKGVKVLRIFVLEQKYLRNIRQRAKLFRSTISGNQVSMIFSRWRKLATLSRKTRIVTLRYLQNKLLPAVWQGWIEYLKAKRERKDKTLTATLCWKNAFLRKAWNALIFAHKVEKERHELVLRAGSHYRSRRLRKALAFWYQSSEEKQHFRAVCGQLVARWRMQTAYHCFSSLNDHKIYSKTLRVSANTVKIRVRTTAILKVWYAWRKLIFISRSCKRRMLQRYWTAWVRSRQSRKVLQGFQEQIQAQVLKSTQRRCMTSWKQFIATRKMEKTMVLMSSAFAETQLLKRVWLCWIKYVAHTLVVKSRMKNALIHMHFQLQFKAFRAFQTFTSLQKWKKHAKTRVLTFRFKRLNTRYFSEWKAVIKHQINQRQQLTHYLNVMQHSLQSKSFSAWFSFVSRRKMLRTKVSQSLAFRTQLCSRMVFQTWRMFVDKVHRNRLAQGFYTAKTSAHVIKRWKQYVVLCKIARMTGTNELRLVESSFLLWRKAVAATHRIREFRAKSTRRQWLALVAMVFRSWKRRSNTNVHCRKLLASVAVGNHLRFRFMLWQWFTTHRKRLANLLLIVADPTAETSSPTLENDDNESGIVIRDELECLPPNWTLTGDQALVTLGQKLAQKARVLQRFDVTWDLPQAWHRWRQIFHAHLFYRMRRQQFFFILWQRFARQQRRNRFIIIKLTIQRRAASLLTVFRAWAELVTRVKQLQKDRLRERELWILVTTEMARRERRQLKKHWHAWKFHVGESRHLQKSLDVYYRARLLTKFWLLWTHDYRQIMSEARRETQRIGARMRIFYLRRAVRSLKDHQKRSKRARLVLEFFGNRRYDTLLPELLAKWRKWSQRQKEVACCLEAARRNKTRRYFILWKVWKNTRKWQRVVVNSFRSKSVEQRRREIWRRWRRYVKKRVAKDLALQNAAIFHIGTRLKRWLHYTQSAIQSREQADTADMQLCVFRGHRAVNRWREFSRARRLRCLYQRFVLRKHIQLWHSAVKYTVAMRFDEFLLRSKAKKMLAAWQKVTMKHQYWRKLCGSFVSKKETQTTRRVFIRWQQFVIKRQGKRLAAMHAEQRLLQKVWRYWNRATLASQLRRGEQLEQAAEHEMATLLRHSLGVWQMAAKKQRERRFVLLSCIVKLQSVAGHHILEIVFQSWKRVVDCRRRCGAALLKRERRIAKNVFIYWLRGIRERQRRREQLQSAEIYHSQRLKSSFFFYWQTYALAWQDAAKPIARRHYRQMVLPTRIVADTHGESESEDEVRRPTSPVMKRLRQKKANRTRSAEKVGEESDMVTLSDAVEISMDVKKRLLLLGKWKS